MSERGDVAPEVLDALRGICAALPEVREEVAWVGVRWRIRTATFCHVLEIADGRPPVYASTFGTDGPCTVLTFQSDGEELEALGRMGHPFVRPPWRPGIVGMVIDDDVDWSDVAELVTESYCLLAPKRLAAAVARPGESA